MTYPLGGVKNWCQITNINNFIKNLLRAPPDMCINKIAPTFCKLRLSKYSLKRAYFIPTQSLQVVLTKYHRLRGLHLLPY